ncbi:MAG: hypothetical protein EOO85_30140, partial [Pedobacter sp.]
MYYRITKRVSFSITFIVLFFFSNLSAQVKSPLKQQVNLQFAADSLTKSIFKLEQYTGLNFAYDPDQLKNAKSASYHFVQASLESVLTKLLFGTGLGFSVVGNDI